ncbi:hypothetical protein NEIELOOT_01984 [Neisseria elongata subsp. glycolytica ATCC 29315]|uniref:Uncharacterized protein n=1 Tax=Neisseria elongata subsp. glycolytica ATCC 29315 TaxID=546263 RepID=D4DSE0_NEIEG|nr:hypothetical protein NEIELOOT_01984 [Neisseria elongata subsp. glycolytica ATCC 29315]
MPRLAVLSVLSAVSSPCPDLNLIHYKNGIGLYNNRCLSILFFRRIYAETSNR